MRSNKGHAPNHPVQAIAGGTDRRFLLFYTGLLSAASPGAQLKDSP